MLTTIIIPAFNRAGMLPRAVESLWRQRDTANLDILIVDDGSTDETSAVATELAQRMSIVRVVRQDNRGVAGARNHGLRHLKAETEIVTFLDSDDVSPPGRFIDLAALDADPALELTYGMMRMVWTLDPQTLLPTDEDTHEAFYNIQMTCALMRRSLVERIGLFDESFRQAEDTDYLLRVFETDTRFLQTRTVALFYMRHNDNMTVDTQAARFFMAKALHTSALRRKADPSRILRKPDFALMPQRKPELS